MESNPVRIEQDVIDAVDTVEFSPGRWRRSGASGLSGFRAQVLVPTLPAAIGTRGVASVTAHTDHLLEDSVFGFLESGHIPHPSAEVLMGFGSVWNRSDDGLAAR
jgi:hypothetical protein